MRTDLPESQVEEAMKLEARGLVELYKIDLNIPLAKGGGLITLFLSPQKEATWQGATWYDGTPCAMSETSYNVTGETTRPKFSIVNPNSVWSRYAHQGYLNNAVINRYRVLTTDIAANNNSFELKLWRVSRLMAVTAQSVVVECRTALDGQAFKIPPDTYRPPIYPTVSVQ